MSRRKRPADEPLKSAAEAKVARRDEKELGWTDVFEDGDGRGLPPMFFCSDAAQPGSEKIAAFDLDWTVVKTKSEKNFAVDANDWCWLFASVPDNLRQLNRDGFRVVFFTNQAGLEKKKLTVASVKNRIEDVTKKLEIPITSFVATGENHFRKPFTGLWDHFVSHCNEGVPVDLTRSFFVGDAAGRQKDWAKGKKRDFSSSDRKFAANVGLKFYTPEEYFLKANAAPFQWGDCLNPVSFLDQVQSNCLPHGGPFHKDSQEMVVVVGMPASGKSSFCGRHLIPHGYVHVNRDELKTQAKCIQLTKESLKAGKSVVVDNTNPTKGSRMEFLKIAVEAKVPCRCFVFDTSVQLAKHLSYMRQNLTRGKIRRIPDVAYNVYAKGFQNPQLDEGFTEVLHIPFVPELTDPKAKKLFLQWTG